MNRRLKHSVLLRIFAHDDTETLEGVLLTFGRAALRTERRINHVAKTQDGEYLAEVHAEETMLVDDLLGCAFVAAQTYITRIVSRTCWLHSRVKRDFQNLKTMDGKKDSIVKNFSKRITNAGYSEIQVIDAFANYFKHHEEWPVNWDKAVGRAKPTIAVIRSVGVSKNSPDNFRKGLASLGIDRVSDVFRIATILREWHRDLIEAHREELKALAAETEKLNP